MRSRSRGRPDGVPPRVRIPVVVGRRVRLGARLGVDAGSVRIGLARSDPAGVLATPLETVGRGQGDLDRIAEIAAEHDVIEVIVGMPTSLSGREGPSGQAVREFAVALAVRVSPLVVRLVDERFSTLTAERTLRGRGVRGTARRNVVDQEAAVVILQAALDAERSSGNLPGEVVRGQV